MNTDFVDGQPGGPGAEASRTAMQAVQNDNVDQTRQRQRVMQKPSNARDEPSSDPEESQSEGAPQTPQRKKKTQTPYKPRLATLVRMDLEDSVKDAISAQDLLAAILDWLEEERRIRDDLHAEISELVFIDHRMQKLQALELKSLQRIGILESRVARLALTLTAIERRLTTRLTAAKEAITSTGPAHMPGHKVKKGEESQPHAD